MESLLIVSLHYPFTIWTNHMVDWLLVAATTIIWSCAGGRPRMQETACELDRW